MTGLKTRRRPVYHTLVLAFVITAISLVPTPSVAAPDVSRGSGGDMVATLYFEDAVRTGHSTMDEGGAAVFNGTLVLWAEDGARGPVRIDLNASTESGWTAGVEPAGVTLPAGADRANFTVTVEVPGQVEFGWDERVETAGIATDLESGARLEIPTAYSTVAVGRHYGLNVTLEEYDRSVRRGTWAKYRFRITNTGNTHDTVRFYLMNTQNMARKFFEFNEGSGEVSIPPFEHVYFDVELMPTPETPVGEYEVSFLFSSRGGSSHGSEPTNVGIKRTLEVKPSNMFKDPLMILFIIIIAITVTGAASGGIKRKRREKFRAALKDEKAGQIRHTK